MPDAWSYVPLADVAHINMGQSPPSVTVNEHGSGVPFLQGNAEFGSRYPEPTKSCTRPQKQARSGDILLSVRAPVGAVNLADKPVCIGRGLSAITATRVDPGFLWYAIRRQVADLVRVAQGSTFAAVTRADLCALAIPLPTRPEQRRIAAILSSVDDAIEKTQAVIHQMQVVKRGLMQEMLTRSIPGRHRSAACVPSDGWSLKRIGELGNVVTGRTPSTKKLAYWHGRIPFVTPGDLGRAKKIDSAGRYVTNEGLAQAREVPPGTVMVTCIGTIGKLGIAQRRCCTNQQINSVIPKTSIVQSEFLYYALSFASDALAGIAATTALPIVSKNHFLRFSLRIPPLAEQEEIAIVLAGVDRSVDANKAYQTTLSEMKVGLMSVLLTGELRVTPDPEPE